MVRLSVIVLLFALIALSSSGGIPARSPKQALPSAPIVTTNDAPLTGGYRRMFKRQCSPPYVMPDSGYFCIFG
ncbi:hypothetical protein QR680_003686 [Steinernema hermaphroditum]|uniref:Uncharacterized protein n=1 Tax=Steinernema hermaphroditum TaxID=289476 RepID=A0AA39LSD6_9BILA|nr:hypothetical protein QR680_003686 [Steinernema hermaphroditum]